MRYRQLGQSGIQASVIAVGTWAIGGWTWGGTDEADSTAAIHAGLDAGNGRVPSEARASASASPGLGRRQGANSAVQKRYSGWLYRR